MAQPRVLTAEMRLNETFDTVAELYDRARPRDPPRSSTTLRR